MKKVYLTFIGLLMVMLVSAQQNILIQNDFWKKNPSVSTIKKAIKDGNSPVEKNSRSFDATALAILEGASVDAVDYLISLKEVSVNTRTHDGRTYLIWAAYKGNLPVIQLLLKKGADVSLKGTHGFDAINFAAFAGIDNKELYDALINGGADITQTNNDGASAILLVASRVKDASLIDYFVSKGLDINSVDEEGNGIFNYAARGGNIPLMKILVDRGIAYKNTNKEGANAVLFAAKGTRRGAPDLETFEFLASLGLKMNTTDRIGNTPLTIISGKAKNLELINYFIKKGVEVNRVNEEGTNALLSAAGNTIEIVERLATLTKDLNHANKDGVTALAIAMKYNSAEVVSMLLERGASVDVNDKDGNSILYYWATTNSVRRSATKVDQTKLALLKKQGFDVAKAQPNGNNLFHIAVETENMDLLKLALAEDVDINAKNKEGYTPLLKAALLAKDTQILKFLVANGADVKATTDFEESAYDLASENELLKEAKASIEFLK
ncbi:ankyrin repeat domain-containing protein [Neptunitalea lumnitzerae]|uniref:Ankyrin repeat n=1 Tax=Neptunitalea lumnitzerae TaxID=2965509 RepID=A0ABQ5MJT5_9FLAO|nr:ankyrin repeat domain-containing protein [Neptunitalea sp. Y10]GLB49310.1 hypothetical protein Y10_16780 [Neptunitalea sp. Y10]